MATTSSSQSSCQPLHHENHSIMSTTSLWSSCEVWASRNAWIHGWKDSRAQNPVFVRVKWPSVVAAGGSLFARFRASIRESGRQNLLAGHQWIRSATRDSQQPTSHRVPILKLPPPPFAILPVDVHHRFTCIILYVNVYTIWMYLK